MNRWKVIMATIIMGLATLTAGCQYLPAILPVVSDIITEIIDAQRKAEQLDEAVQGYFEKYPNKAMEAKWKGAMDKVHASIDVALKAAHGVEDVAEQDVAGAMHNFVLAWQEARELAMSIGVVGAAGVVSAGPMAGVVIGEPLAVQRLQGGG